MVSKLVFYFVFMVAISAASLRAEPVDLFVLAGQSNMQGYRGDARLYPADPKKLDQQIGFYWVAPGLSSSGGKWVQLQPQGGLFPRGHFGPEITFARELAQAGLRPVIFKYSSGSTSLAGNWLAPGSHGMYDDMVKELQKAIALQEKAGNKLTVRALVWIQGESDAQTDEMAVNYAARLTALIKDFRENVVRNPRLPVILGVDEQHPWVKEHLVVVESQKRMALMDSCEVFTSMVGLPKFDSTHLTPSGLETHGRLLQKAYMKLREKCN
jgi:hypothetical protein